ncbi:MBL fold metallo-hydrolase [Desulfosudis oleivorans]|uniref:Beta-lactamase domain protein n=1 Tax=Desulfosudis oleivorans (strain DSM 6200 / JCM 39069 / Hxd3) TaxID=96561 RepID=A8ZWX8_DESOH|nr:MBL fold metallo-hydrolase [Desulfosudis oleivorans]ABW66834.1 beta-lactamase domain protein [Desulfosudis oleivorans Hxd3]
MKTYAIRQPRPEVYRIALAPPMEGFDNFITAWVYRGKKTLLVDTGPSVTADALLSALAEIRCRPDAILLTHIHIDHAGGIGRVSNAFPGTPVICHEKAIPHLVNPEKLWQSTRQTLGAMAEAYGPIDPVPETRLMNATELSCGLCRPVMTPGHAPHHISYLTPDNTLFAGEAGGVNLDLGDGHICLRPATPPRFDLKITVASMDRLIDTAPAVICYGHNSLRTNAVELLCRHRQQLFSWQALIGNEMEKGETGTLLSRCADRLLKEDTLLAGLSQVGPAVFQREQFFIKNSLAGFIGYLNDLRSLAR